MCSKDQKPESAKLKTTHGRKDGPLSKRFREGGNMKRNGHRTPFNTTQWMKDLNDRLDTVKASEESLSRTLFDINCSRIFLDPSPRVTEIKQMGPS